jgi:hypothetical protein
VGSGGNRGGAFEQALQNGTLLGNRESLQPYGETIDQNLDVKSRSFCVVRRSTVRRRGWRSSAEPSDRLSPSLRDDQGSFPDDAGAQAIV